ncbi:apolipoprotein d [Plakobranchus ocellatus]|uniref:Apolipoprotein D n=1 Tax=Plakobranchus ocellatus TaxID=259542 RepID=A0AAV3Y3A0_9GAST|nr:apolipoprotein d [Plakobranchus ocellatus]
MAALQLLLSVCLVASASGFIVMSVGQCPNIPTKPDFDLNKYLGLWFSYENFDAPFQWATTCVSALYSLKPNGNIRVINSGFRDIRIFGRSVHRSSTRAVGEAYIVNSTQPGGLNVRFGNQPDLDGGKANYLVVDTDYDNYSVVYSCSQQSILKIELAWILTRVRGQAPANVDAIKANLEAYDVDTSNFKRIDHSNCS